MREETDKFRKKDGREAAEREHDTKYLDNDALDDDLTVPEVHEGEGQIVSSDKPQNQEWNARENEQRP